ncbi:MAG: hypothetical protein ACI825_001301 [Planctomycetota bacterium]|jgi:hypothetical protein
MFLLRKIYALRYPQVILSQNNKNKYFNLRQQPPIY